MHAAFSLPHNLLPLVLMLSAAAANNIINNNGTYYDIPRIAPIILVPAESAMPWVYCCLPIIVI